MNEDIEIKIKAERQRGFRAGIRFKELMEYLDWNRGNLYRICQEIDRAYKNGTLKEYEKSEGASLSRELKGTLRIRREAEKMFINLIVAGYIFTSQQEEDMRRSFIPFDANHRYICYMMAYDKDGNPIHETKTAGKRK